MLFIPRIDRRTRVAPGELCCNCLSYDAPTCLPQARHEYRIRLGRAARVRRRVVLGRHVRRVDEIFYADGNTGKWEPYVGLIDHRRVRQITECVQPRLTLPGGLIGGFNALLDRQNTALDSTAEIGRA